MDLALQWERICTLEGIGDFFFVALRSGPAECCQLIPSGVFPCARIVHTHRRCKASYSSVDGGGSGGMGG